MNKKNVGSSRRSVEIFNFQQEPISRIMQLHYIPVTEFS